MSIPSKFNSTKLQNQFWFKSKFNHYKGVFMLNDPKPVDPGPAPIDPSDI
jgi:hypothetical protein